MIISELVYFLHTVETNQTTPRPTSSPYFISLLYLPTSPPRRLNYAIPHHLASLRRVIVLQTFRASSYIYVIISLRPIAFYYLLTYPARLTDRQQRADRPNGSPIADTHPPCQNDFGGGAAGVGYGG